MEAGTIKEEINLGVIFNSISDVCEDLGKFDGIDGVVFLNLGYNSMTRTDSRTHCLTRLLLCPIFNKQVLVRLGPSLTLEVSSLVETLIQEDQMALLLRYFMELIV
jgi:cytochrome P450